MQALKKHTTEIQGGNKKQGNGKILGAQVYYNCFQNLYACEIYMLVCHFVYP